jgi:membrane protein YdbS with pleckstrin-like domain
MKKIIEKIIKDVMANYELLSGAVAFLIGFGIVAPISVYAWEKMGWGSLLYSTAILVIGVILQIFLIVIKKKHHRELQKG